MARVSIRTLGKRFGETAAVRNVSIEIEDGEFLVLVGPSGSGKSTVLRMIAGLEDPTEGEIAIGGRDVTHIPPKDRDIAMVFQDYALYPHMTVYENMAFGLQARRAPQELIRRRVEEAGAILNVGDLLERFPGQLSGGQRQRVAMGRAIVRDPKVFLFDEPLSNLDAKLRVQMRTEIKKLHQKLGTTVVYVTHDQVEAMTLASRVVILREGLIEQVGTPEAIYHAPANRFVAGFVGSPSMNFLPCTLEAAAPALLFRDGARLVLDAAFVQRAGDLAGRSIVFGIRPENLAPAAVPGAGTLTLRVDVVEPLGSDTLVIGQLGGAEVIARFPQGHAARPGDALEVRPELARAHLFEAESSVRIGALP